MPTTRFERRRLTVAGADAVVADAANGVPLTEALTGADVDWRSIRTEVIASERAIIVGERIAGPVLALKWFGPDQPTTIHDHGVAGAALVVEGGSRYERFARLEGNHVTCVAVENLGPGEISAWGAPPHDVHRQTGLGDGSIELVLLAGAPKDADEFVEVGS